MSRILVDEFVASYNISTNKQSVTVFVVADILCVDWRWRYTKDRSVIITRCNACSNAIDTEIIFVLMRWCCRRNYRYIQWTWSCCYCCCHCCLNYVLRFNTFVTVSVTVTVVVVVVAAALCCSVIDDDSVYCGCSNYCWCWGTCICHPCYYYSIDSSDSDRIVVS